MPTIPAAQNFNKFKNTSDFFCPRQRQPNTHGRVEVKDMELKLDLTLRKCNDCPAPPCNKSFWWAPKPPKPQQIGEKKRKPPPPPEPYKNVMHDKRVVRGPVLAKNSLLDVNPFDKAALHRRTQALLKKSRQCRNQRNVLGTPPPVAGRRHEDIQTDKYLELLEARQPEFNVETQTDIFLEKVPTPPYVAAKVGIDVATEIGDGELFHFDAEAQPLIEILVDGAIEQSILEVVHEQELDALRRKADEYLAQREAELAELRRLEAEEIRLQAEKERRLRQDAIARELDEELQRGVVAAKLLQGHISSLLPEIIENLEPATDAVKMDHLYNTLCPWLADEVEVEAHRIVDTRRILLAIITEIVKDRARIYMGWSDGETPEPLPLGEMEEGEEVELECCLCESSSILDCSPSRELPVEPTVQPTVEATVEPTVETSAPQ